MNLTNDSDIISQFNKEEAYRQIPTAVFLGLIGVVGAIGNGVVCYVYGFLYKQSNSRIFFICLAAVDLFTCLVNIPLEIISLVNQYQFEMPYLCKTSRMLNVFTSLYSSAILLAIAVDRFTKICRPHGKQISKELTSKLCVILLVISIALTWPPLVTYGVKTSVITEQGIQFIGQECSVDDSFTNSIYHRGYVISFFILFVAAVVSLIILYALIGRRVRFFVFKQEQPRSLSNTNDTQSMDSESRNGGLSNLQRSNVIARSNEYVTMSRENSTDMTLEDGLNDEIPMDTESIKKEAPIRRKIMHQPSSTQLDQIRRKRKLARNTTYLMFLVTLSFIFSYLPHLILVSIDSVVSTFVVSLDATGRAAYRFFLRSYFTNSALNPIIYSVFDRKFRSVLKLCISKLKSKMCGCKKYKM